MTKRDVVCGAVLVAAAMGLSAQDARKVVEPRIPAACVTLGAELVAAEGGLEETDEAKLDTVRIQRAIDGCGAGKAVMLGRAGKHNAFLSGPLHLREGVTLVVEHGVTLFAARDPKLYETAPGSCGIVNDSGRGCNPLIAVEGVAHAGVMGDGVIDGRGGARLLGQKVSWWDLAEEARPNRRQQVPRILVAEHADDFTLYRITLKNSPNFHVVYSHGDGFTVWGIRIDTPQRLARNTDGVDPMGSKNITITRSYIRTGDDNVAIKGGDAISNVTVSHNHFYWGHGMSIGSETNGGVSRIRVTDLSLDGPDNGIRIKSNGSRGGLVEDVVYDDVCVRNSPNPIVLDTGYTAAGTVQGNSPPTFREVTLKDVRVSGGGKISFNGYDKEHRAGARLDGVVTTDGAAYRYSLNHADLRLGPGLVNLKLPAGTDSTVSAGSMVVGRPGTAASCAEKFVSFPVE